MFNEMTELTSINEINKEAFICDFAFDPCGYSMNGMDGESYSIICVFFWNFFVDFFFMNPMKMMKNTKEEANFLGFFCHVGFY